MRRSGSRDKLLETATRLFYRHGINNVGIDLVLSRSGVAKATLYHHFKSKDELVLAFLDKINAHWSQWLQKRVSESKLRGPKKPLAVFDALGEWFLTEEFRGCPFINTAAEVHNPRSPIHQAAWGFKQELRAYLLNLAREAGYDDAERIADQLLLLIDGVIVRAAMQGDPGVAATAKRAAEALLAAAQRAVN